MEAQQRIDQVTGVLQDIGRPSHNLREAAGQAMPLKLCLSSVRTLVVGEIEFAPRGERPLGPLQVAWRPYVVRIQKADMIDLAGQRLQAGIARDRGTGVGLAECYDLPSERRQTFQLRLRGHRRRIVNQHHQHLAVSALCHDRLHGPAQQPRHALVERHHDANPGHPADLPGKAKGLCPQNRHPRLSERTDFENIRPR